MDGKVRIVAEGVEGMSNQPITFTADEFYGLLKGIAEHRNWYVQRDGSPEFTALTKLENAVPQALLAGGQSS